jgi:hypothetical protein
VDSFGPPDLNPFYAIFGCMCPLRGGVGNEYSIIPVP